MIIVLLKVSAIAIYNASKGVNHKSILSQKPIIEVNATWPNQVINDALPVSLIIFAFNPIHTINNKSDIHICENVSKTSPWAKKFNT